MSKTQAERVEALTPKMVRVSLPGEQICYVYFDTQGEVGFVQLSLRTKGDSHAMRRTLRINGPTAQKAIIAARNTTQQQGG